MSEGVRSTMYNPVNVPLCDLKIGDKLMPLLYKVELHPQILDVLDDWSLAACQAYFIMKVHLGPFFNLREMYAEFDRLMTIERHKLPGRVSISSRKVGVIHRKKEEAARRS